MSSKPITYAQMVTAAEQIIDEVAAEVGVNKVEFLSAVADAMDALDSPIPTVRVFATNQKGSVQ